jgi:hypothetical protein
MFVSGRSVAGSAKNWDVLQETKANGQTRRKVVRVNENLWNIGEGQCLSE